MRTIHDLTKRVEEAHTRHLKEVKSLEEQTRNVSAGTSPQPATTLVTAGGNDVSFESLVGGGSNVINGNNSSSGQENDMFGSMLSPATQSGPRTQNNKTSSATPTWSNPPAVSSATSAANILNNSWSSPPQQHNQTVASNWNSAKPIKPISSPKTVQNNSLSNGMNNMSMNNNNYSQQNSSWSPSLQTIKPIVQGQPFTSGTGPSFQMSNNSGSANYNALKGLTSNTNNFNQQTSMMPLSSTMGLLQPTTTSSNTNNTTPKATKPVNLHAFDPLG